MLFVICSLLLLLHMQTAWHNLPAKTCQSGCSVSNAATAAAAHTECADTTVSCLTYLLASMQRLCSVLLLLHMQAARCQCVWRVGAAGAAVPPGLCVGQPPGPGLHAEQGPGAQWAAGQLHSALLYYFIPLSSPLAPISICRQPQMFSIQVACLSVDCCTGVDVRAVYGSC